MGWPMYFPVVVDVRYDSLSVYNENFAHHSGICKMNHAGMCRLSGENMIRRYGGCAEWTTQDRISNILSSQCFIKQYFISREYGRD